MKKPEKELSKLSVFIISIAIAIVIVLPLSYVLDIPRKSNPETKQTESVSLPSQLAREKITAMKQGLSTSRFDQIEQEKNKLEQSLFVLRKKDSEIEKIQNELIAKAHSSTQKITSLMTATAPKRDSRPTNKKLSSVPLLTYGDMQKDESIQRSLQSIQYNEAYVNKLNEIGKKIKVAINRSEFIIDKVDTDLRVATVIGKDMIDKMRNEISEGIKENIPLSTDLDLNNQDIELTADLADIWQRIYKQWLGDRNKIQDITETLDKFKKSIPVLEEKKSELMMLSRTAYEKASSSRNTIQNLRQKGGISAGIDSVGLSHYVNYSCASYEEIEWDKETMKELQSIQHNEVYAEVLIAVSSRFTNAILNSNSIMQRIDINSNSTITRIAKNELEEIFGEIKKALKDNSSLINNLDINKIRAESSVTPRDIWARMYSNCSVNRVTSGSDIRGTAGGYTTEAL